jgi:hypothetical protein
MIRRKRFQVLLRVVAGTFLFAAAAAISAGVTAARASAAPVFDLQQIEIGYSSGYGTGAGDLNQDGYSDLVVCGYGSTRFYPGNGDGTFDRLGGSRIRGECRDLTIANLDGDLYPDVVTGRPYGSPAIRIFEYDPADGLTVRAEVPVEHSVSAVRVGDIDGDATVDVLAVTRRLDGPETPRLRVFYNDGLGSLSEGSSVEFHNNGSLTVGELTGDSADDIVVGRSAGVVQIIPGSASRGWRRDDGDHGRPRG